MEDVDLDSMLIESNAMLIGVLQHYFTALTAEGWFSAFLAHWLLTGTNLLTQVGIYKTDNATKSVAINPGEFVVGRPSAFKCLPASKHALDKEQQAPTLTA